MGWMELMLIGVVALIVVGPKDLPVLFRQVGKFVGKAKGMAREFSSAMNQAADQAGVKDVTDMLKSAGDAYAKVSNPVAATRSAANDALESVTDLGIDPDDGVVRISLVHYSSREEVDKIVQALDKVLSAWN